jgi:hypothetical protein
MKAQAVVLWLGVLGAGIGLAACGAQPVTVTSTAPASTSPVSSSAAPKTPATTKTVTKVRTVPPAPPASKSAARPTQAPAPAPAAPPPAVVPNVTDPWAVVAAYYGDIESGDYAQAYALLGNGATTGQSYAQFVAGFSCTGGQSVSENWESGDRVNFDLAATDSCTGATQYFTGTDTVENGTIVGADIVAAG